MGVPHGYGEQVSGYGIISGDCISSLYDGTVSTPEPAPLRADAERNRQRLLEAARELFAERGLDVTLDEIARHAGVGTGTAYRRFPNKDALIEALMVERFGELRRSPRNASRSPTRGAG